MDEKRREEARLRALYEESTRYAEAYRALSHRDFAAVYPLAFGYVRSKYLLTPEQCESEKLLDLADVSLRQTLALKRRGIQVGEIARSCAGASSVITKKILLMKAMQEDFQISMTPEEFAAIDTLTDLAGFLAADRSGKTVPETTEVREKGKAALFDPMVVRKDFPALAETVHGKPLVYLDSAATAQMPRAVMDAVSEIELARGNIHRGIHALSEKCTAAYEEARRTCAEFLGAALEQITFTAGTTDGINRVAAALGTMPGGVVATAMEHHADLVPWQQACKALGRPFRVCPVLPDGTLDMETLDKLLDGDISVLAVTHASNVLGIVNPVEELARMAHTHGIRILADGAQSACHRKIDVNTLGCDWFVCSGHKLGGPFGIGLLYSREPLPPTRFGGGMVDRVTEEDATFLPAPASGEAGTPNVSGAAGLGAAIRYRRALPAGWQDHERELLRRAEALLRQIPGVRILGTGEKEGCLSFTAEGAQPLDIALLMDSAGIALRSGNHCAQPLMAALGVDHTLRISPAYYNTTAEIDAFAGALRRILPVLRAENGRR